jgi:hypothetical protein
LENFYLFLHKQLNQNWLRAKPNASSFTTARTFERKPVGAAANISAHLLRGFAYLALRARLHPGHLGHLSAAFAERVHGEHLVGGRHFKGFAVLSRASGRRGA